MNIFYTAYLINNWEEVLLEQLHIMKESGLLEAANKMYIHAHAPNDELKKICDEYDKIELVEELENRCEIPAIEHLMESTEEYNLYFHSKGVSHPSSPNVKSWRDYMNHFNLALWKDCIYELENGAKAVGVNFSTIHYPHFSGNYWWTTKENTDNIKFKIGDRSDCEWYIGHGKGKYVSLHQSDVNHYHQVYDKSKWNINKLICQL